MLLLPLMLSAVNDAAVAVTGAAVAINAVCCY